MNNKLYFRTSENSTDIIIRTLNDINHMKKIYNINKRENQYFNNTYKEKEGKSKDRHHSKDCKILFFIKL